jgi:Fe-S oxidoreductase
MKERLEKYRSFKLFMDICVRCGACADKCHFFIGSGDPKNMPVLRAELLRSVYRKDFTGRQALRPPGGRARADRGRAQGVVLLLLPVHRVPPLLRLLPLRHRHRRDHDDGRELLNLVGSTSTG